MADADGRTAVEVVELVKRYPKRDVNAVDGLSFAIREGEVFGLLGPNGAGKTTTVGVLTTRVEATSGRAILAGIDVLRDPVAARAGLAVVPQRSNLDRSLTPGRTSPSTPRTTASAAPSATPAPPRCSSSLARRSRPTSRWTGTPAAWPSA